VGIEKTTHQQEAHEMMEQSNTDSMSFGSLGRREVEARFDGGNITSDGGGLLLREVEKKAGLIRKLAECFIDHRDPRYTEFSVEELLSQRIFGLALGYEDLNDHEELRKDPLLATLANRRDPTGQDRARLEDRGCPLAGKSTLNRLELTPKGEINKYKKIEYCEEEMEAYFVSLFLGCHETAPNFIVLDLDATNDPVHGSQEGRFFHGYYDEYCYLPLYVFCGDFLLVAKLRSASNEAADGSLEVAKNVVAQIHAVWPETVILFRGDSGFCRDDFMDWCETHESKKLHYLFGLAKNDRLIKNIEKELKQAEKEYPAAKKHLEEKRGQLAAEGKSKKEILEALQSIDNPCRRFSEFQYATLKSWTRERRVIAKAEFLEDGRNPRFVVTSLTKEFAGPQALYEEHYCARGDMENRIKENQLYLFADRTSTALLRSNQLRLWFSSVAYMFFVLIRHYGLKDTGEARAQCGTIRNKLFKIGAQVIVTCRRVWIRFATGYPFKELFFTVLRNLRAMPTCLKC